MQFVDNSSLLLGAEKIYRSILCLSGNLPDKSFFGLPLPVIAVDGAANILDRIGITIHTIIGDLDSVDPLVCEKYYSVYMDSQDYSDFEKALEYLKSNNFLPSIICGVNGGYVDHILNNINIFANSESIFFDPPIIGYAVKAGAAKSFTLPIKSKISIIGFGNALASTSGLRWELNKYNLSFPGPTSCFNRTISDTISISVHEGVVLVMIYMQEIHDAGIMGY